MSVSQFTIARTLDTSCFKKCMCLVVTYLIYIHTVSWTDIQHELFVYIFTVSNDAVKLSSDYLYVFALGKF